MKKTFADFVKQFEQATEEEKLELLEMMNYPFVREIEEAYAQGEKADVVREIKRSQQLIYDRWCETLGSERKVARIQRLKEDIASQFVSLQENPASSLTNSQKESLDLFFESSNLLILENALISIRRRLFSNNSTSTKNKFQISTPAVLFPNQKYGNNAVSYLEEKYRQKIVELELDQVGLVDVQLQHQTNVTIRDEKLKINYCDEHASHHSYKYHNYSYALVVQYDASKKKVYKK